MLPYFQVPFGFLFLILIFLLLAYGAAYGTARSGIAIAAVGTGKPEIIVKSLLPVIMAGILSLYGMVIAIFIALCVDSQRPMSLFAGALQMGAGLSVGLACLAAGLAIGALGDAGVRGYARQSRLLNGFILLLVFAEILGTLL